MTPSEPTFIPAWKGAHPQDCDYYAWWVNALTEQGLHAKTDIAMALGIMSEHIDILETQLRTRSAVETADIRRQLAEATCKECGAVSGDHVEGCSAVKAICEHEWKIDGAHSNEYCGKCYIPKPSGGTPAPRCPTRLQYTGGESRCVRDAGHGGNCLF